jgi:hypothetical protein
MWDAEDDVNRVAVQLLEEARLSANGHSRMTVDDARAIASVLHQYYFAVGSLGPRDQISTTKPEINPVCSRAYPLGLQITLVVPSR